MKTKNVKKLALTCLATAFLACGSIGLVVADFETSAATDSIGSFEMVGGASIRTVSGTTGIRYTAKFDETLYNVVTEDDDKQFGMIITKLDYYLQAKAANSDLIAGLDSLGANKYVLISESSANPCTPYLYTLPSGETEYRVSGALTNIRYANADSTWMGVGVVITGNGDAQDTYEYALTDETNARTTAYVASAALNDDEFGYKDYEKDVMRNYVYTYAAKVDGVEQTAFDAQEDKSAYLDGVTATISGIDTSAKYNQNVDGKETYFTVNEKERVNIVATTAAGNPLDLACETASDNAEVVKVENFNDLTPLKNGYATLTVSSDILGDWTETVTAYAGSESVVKLTETSIFGWSGAQGGYHSSSETDTIKGEEYYGYVGRGTSGTVQFWAYSDTLSVYYIDYMIAQGYTHIRMPFYFDTSLSHELFEGVSESDRETSPIIRGQVAKHISGVESYKDTTVDCDEWIYWDMDINHYRAHFAELDNAAVDTYGVKTTINDRWFYTNALISSIKNTLVYLGEQTFVKSSDYTVVGEDTSANFGDIVDLSATYTTTADIVLSYEVNGTSQNKLLAAVNGENAITINGNVYKETLDGWTLSVSKSADATKTLTVSGGIKAVNLLDVNGKENAVAIADYNGASDLAELGYTVSQSYVKRYSDGNEVLEGSIANTERGIFYANVTAEKDGETYTYSTTIDVYNSTEPVEYESFGHDDSAYAVKAYYYIAGRNQSATYEYLTTTYTVDAKKGMHMEVGDGYLSVVNFSDSDISNSYVQTAYGDLSSSLTGMGYLAVDQSKITPEGPLTVAYGDSNAQINIYVTPRHTKEYYAMHAETDTESVLKYAFAGGFSSNSNDVKVAGLTSIANGKATLTWKQLWAARWYSNITTTCTLSMIVDNYDALNDLQCAVYSIQAPNGNSETKVHNGIAKIGALLF